MYILPICKNVQLCSQLIFMSYYHHGCHCCFRFHSHFFQFHFLSYFHFHFIPYFQRNCDWFLLIQNPLPLSLLTYKGDLNLSLMFVSPENLTGRKKDGRCGSKGSLHVLIKQARNLTAVRANGSSDPFCKGYVTHCSYDE